MATAVLLLHSIVLVSVRNDFDNINGSALQQNGCWCFKSEVQGCFLFIMSIAMQNGQLQRAQMGDREEQSPCYYDVLWRHSASGIFPFLF